MVAVAALVVGGPVLMATVATAPLETQAVALADRVVPADWEVILPALQLAAAAAAVQAAVAPAIQLLAEQAPAVRVVAELPVDTPGLVAEEDQEEVLVVWDQVQLVLQEALLAAAAAGLAKPWAEHMAAVAADRIVLPAPALQAAAAEPASLQPIAAGFHHSILRTYRWLLKAQFTPVTRSL
jgi:hypothetical protein